MIGPVFKFGKGLIKSFSLEKKISKLKKIESSNIKDLVVDNEYAQIYLDQLEYYDLKKKKEPINELIRKNIQIIQKMDKYTNKKELLSQVATQFDVARIVSSLQKMQLAQDFFAAGIIECDDNLKKLSESLDTTIKSINKNNDSLKEEICEKSKEIKEQIENELKLFSGKHEKQLFRVKISLGILFIITIIAFFVLFINIA